MNAPTTHRNTNANEAQFLAPETHQRAGAKTSVSVDDRIVELLPQYKGGLTLERLANNLGDPERIGYLLDPYEVAAAVERLTSSGALRKVGQRLVTAAQVDADVASDAHSDDHAAPSAEGFKVEASTCDPTTRDSKRDPPVAVHITCSRREASERARFLVRRGYWVEVFDVASRELLAGPFDPDQRVPAYIL